jgi:hypothetical protein
VIHPGNLPITRFPRNDPWRLEREDQVAHLVAAVLVVLVVHGHPEDLTWAGQPLVVALTFLGHSGWSPIPLDPHAFGCSSAVVPHEWGRRGEAGLIVSVALGAVEKAATATGPAGKLPFGEDTHTSV